MDVQNEDLGFLILWCFLTLWLQQQMSFFFFWQLFLSHLCKNKQTKKNECIVNCELDWFEVVCRVPGPGPGIMFQWVTSMWAPVIPDRSPPPCLLLLHAGDRLLPGPLAPCHRLRGSLPAVCGLGRSLLVSSRSVDPTGMCARQIILALELALRQPGSCGWLVSLARRLSRGSPVALVEWEAGVLQGAWAQAPPTTLAHLVLWQTHENKWCAEVVMKGGEAASEALEKRLNWKVALITRGSTRPHLTAYHMRSDSVQLPLITWKFVLCTDSPLTRCIRSVCDVKFRRLSRLLSFSQFGD